MHLVLRLLRGLADPDIARVLAHYGFDESERAKGWELLSATAPLALPVDPSLAAPKVLEALDRFENHWFPITRFTLDAHHPRISARFFEGLGQTSGVEVLVSVTLFVDRLELLETGAAPFGSDGPAARDLLAVRGLTSERVAEAKALLDRFRHWEPPMPSDVEDQAKAAEQAAWSWYLEWSRILRHAIPNRGPLQRLGLVSRKASKSGAVRERASTGEHGVEHHES
jgi:hypothetical protein